MELFEPFFDMSLLGIQKNPTLLLAFSQLIRKKDVLLTSLSSATETFAYMNTLDGLSHTLIEQISKIAFIPLLGKLFHK